VLVALALMAVLALLSWRGLDSMLRTRDSTGARINAVALAQVSLLQWQADLNAVQALPLLMNDAALSWDGRVMRLLRRSGTPVLSEDKLKQTPTPNNAAQAAAASADAGMQVVAWTVRDGHWWRWQSPDLRLRGDVWQAWQQAGQWGQNPNEDLRRYEARLMPVQSWQLFYFRENAWVNPLSSAGNSAVPATGNNGMPVNTASSANNNPSPLATPLPDAVQIQLMLDGKDAPDSGKLTLDWVNPAYNPSRS
jgi:general secretion pathway protein J